MAVAHHFSSDGCRLHYVIHGRGEPLVLLHGLGSSGADWAPQLPALTGRFRTIIPDLPGSGRSDPPMVGCTLEQIARSVWSLCDSLRLRRRVNIVGFSLGGALGLEMTLQRPADVRRLALINSLASYRLNHWRKLLEFGVSMALIRLAGMRNMARLSARRLFPMPWQSMLRQLAIDSVSATRPRDYFLIARAMVRWTALDRLHRLRSRALVIAAENDFTAIAEKHELALRLGADFMVMRGSRHATPFDAVTATNDALRALLMDQPLPPSEHWHRDSAEDLKVSNLYSTAWLSRCRRIA